jgi:hypothetical protein
MTNRINPDCVVRLEDHVLYSFRNGQGEVFEC